jgi:gas vesicle protein
MFYKSDSVIPFLAGLGIGVAAAVLFTPGTGHQNRKQIRDIASRAGDALTKRAEDLGDVAADVLTKGKRAWTAEQKKDAKAVSVLKDQAQEKLDDVTRSAKTVVGQIVDKSKEVAHDAGKSLESGGKRLQEA